MTGDDVVAALLFAAAVLLATAATPAPARSPGSVVPFAVLALLVAVMPWVAWPSAQHLLLALVLAGSALDLARRWRRGRRRAVASARAAAVLAACELIAADLRAGLAPEVALRAASSSWPDLAAVARAADLGADVPAALRELSGSPGAGQVRVIAAAWQVAHRSGAGLASALDLAAATLREDRATAAVVATEVAAARATATVLALLPVGVLVLGSGTGGDPTGFLTGTVPGLACLAAGLGLAHAGLAWLDLIADGVGT